MSQTDVQILPIPLILLVHLHILEYPHANCSEYDHQIFNPRTRGLRERAKTMEDVTYFLVGKIEGRSVKNILSTYPCVQPSESLAFRTSLSKYLETLRHQCIYSTAARSGFKVGPHPVPTESEAPWWKEVVVRKSLLEECAGEKFERLVLSLSTHALMKISGSMSPDKMTSSLRTQPVNYTKSIATYHDKRHAWKKVASLLTRREHDLETLRESLSGGINTKYPMVPTEKLQVLAESKLQALLQTDWSGGDGERSLSFLILLAGIKSSRTDHSLENVDLNASLKPTSPPSSLPVAAAHHPSHLRKLRRTIFQPKTKFDIRPSVQSKHKPHVELMLAENSDSEIRMRQNLLDAIAQTDKTRSELKSRLSPLQATTHSNLFWSPPGSSMVSTFVGPVPGKDILISLGLTSEYEALTFDEEAMEKKIEHIRTVVLPPYPAMPDQSAPRKRALEIGGISQVLQTNRNQRDRPINQSTSSSLSSLKSPKMNVPVLPNMSPGRSSRSIKLKSVRFSMAQRRIQRVSSVFNDPFDDEVDRLVDETNDFPTDDEDTDEEGLAFSPIKTPKTKARPTTNRIWTAGTPIQGRRNAPGQGTLMPRVPSALTRSLEMGSSVSLPSMPSTSTAYDDVGDELDYTPRPVRRKLSPREDKESGLDANDLDDEDELGVDPPSMTLKEILLSADTSHFDLLDATANDDLDDLDEMLVEDNSFVWE